MRADKKTVTRPATFSDNPESFKLWSSALLSRDYGKLLLGRGDPLTHTHRYSGSGLPRAINDLLWKIKSIYIIFDPELDLQSSKEIRYSRSSVQGSRRQPSLPPSAWSTAPRAGRRIAAGSSLRPTSCILEHHITLYTSFQDRWRSNHKHPPFNCSKFHVIRCEQWVNCHTSHKCNNLLITL